MISLFNSDNLTVFLEEKADLLYADMIYESLDFTWVNHWWEQLKENGIFIIQTDWHSVAEIKVHTQGLKDAHFLNWLVWKNEFGNFPKNKFRQCHDDILIFSKGKKYKWYPERIQVEKATAKSKGLNKSGRQTKLATSVIVDICLTTVSKERIKKEDGHCIRWQKPIELLDRLFSPFTDEGDLIVDPFLGSGTSAEWCAKNNRRFIGIELDSEPFRLAQKRLNAVYNS
jgi:DNA modification methylase